MTLADVLTLVRSLDLEQQRGLAEALQPLLTDSLPRGGSSAAAKAGSLMGMAGMFKAPGT
ncbi:MAG: hypothetical protein LBH76_02805 [Propionibacteriaceae bacterium]|jgi:hypothetical protein|nr:hypothetical protein [Propionibacteriaceae bacterium]